MNSPTEQQGVADLTARAAAVRAELARRALPSTLIVTDLVNVQWLTGLSASNAAAVVGPTGIHLFTDARYEGKVLVEALGLRLTVARNVLGAAAEALREMIDPSVADDLAGVVGVEADGLTLSQFHSIRAALDPVVARQCEGVVTSQRQVKDAHELACLTTACEVTIAAVDRLIDQVQIGMSEIEIARRLELIFGQLGAQDRAFPTIVGAGPHSAIPHHEPTSRPIEAGDLLVIDCGAKVDGYHADFTRTFAVGAAATSQQLDAHEAVAAAALAARSGLKAGVAVADLDRLARSVLAEAGFEQWFTHGLGHGVGLEIHEPPLISTGSAGTIVDGSVVTIEPGIYLPGAFGIRIEDSCQVTQAGCRILTEYPRDLMRIA